MGEKFALVREENNVYSGVKQGPDLFPYRNLSGSGARTPALGSWVRVWAQGLPSHLTQRTSVSPLRVTMVRRRGLRGNPTDSSTRPSLPISTALFIFNHALW